MIQLWAASNIQRVDYWIRKKIVFYAPLIDSLDFHGVDPATFTRASGSVGLWRDGSLHNIGVNQPAFQYSSGTPLGLRLTTSPAESLQFSAANNLNNASTLIWFEDRVPKSTPTQGNPFLPDGTWNGNKGIHISHICKANAVLSTTEINAIQLAVLDIAQVIPPPPPPPIANVGTFIEETPSGTRNGSNKTFTLSQNPDLGSLEVFWGGLYLKRVPSAPNTLEYTATGTGSRTLTLGSAPQASENLTAHYVTIP